MYKTAPHINARPNSYKSKKIDSASEPQKFWNKREFQAFSSFLR